MILFRRENVVASYEALGRSTSHVNKISIGEETEMNEDTRNSTPTLPHSQGHNIVAWPLTRH